MRSRQRIVARTFASPLKTTAYAKHGGLKERKGSLIQRKALSTPRQKKGGDPPVTHWQPRKGQRATLSKKE